MDNSNELLPIVDNNGNVIGKVARGIAHNGTKILHPWYICTSFQGMETYTYRKDPRGKMFNPGNGTLQWADT